LKKAGSMVESPKTTHGQLITAHHQEIPRAASRSQRISQSYRSFFALEGMQYLRDGRPEPRTHWKSEVLGKRKKTKREIGKVKENRREAKGAAGREPRRGRGRISSCACASARAVSRGEVDWLYEEGESQQQTASSVVLRGGEVAESHDLTSALGSSSLGVQGREVETHDLITNVGVECEGSSSGPWSVVQGDTGEEGKAHNLINSWTRKGHRGSQLQHHLRTSRFRTSASLAKLWRWEQQAIEAHTRHSVGRSEEPKTFMDSVINQLKTAGKEDDADKISSSESIVDFILQDSDGRNSQPQHHLPRSRLTTSMSLADSQPQHHLRSCESRGSQLKPNVRSRLTTSTSLANVEKHHLRSCERRESHPQHHFRSCERQDSQLKPHVPSRLTTSTLLANTCEVVKVASSLPHPPSSSRLPQGSQLTPHLPSEEGRSRDTWRSKKGRAERMFSWMAEGRKEGLEETTMM